MSMSIIGSQADDSRFAHRERKAHLEAFDEFLERQTATQEEQAASTRATAPPPKKTQKRGFFFRKSLR